jgi:hypothetical protein
MPSWSYYSTPPVSTYNIPNWVDPVTDIAQEGGWEALKVGARVAIIVASGVAVSCAGVCLYWCTCRKRQRRR